MTVPLPASLLEAADGLPFLKVTGGGNDFVLIDNRNGRLSGDLTELVRRACHRGLGVGADGFILVGFSKVADLGMVYFNRDGGRASFCGNGVRCVARWAARVGSFPRPLRIETGAGVLTADGADEPPWFTLPLGAAAPVRITLEVASRRVEGVRVRAGVPHLAIQVKDAFAPDVLDDAPALRSHPALGPEGANVDFFTPRGAGSVDARFYERGVEAETLSSGSGSIAVALAVRLLHGPEALVPAPGRPGPAGATIVCRNREGLESRVTINDGASGTEATLAGAVGILFRGRLTREMLEMQGAAPECIRAGAGSARTGAGRGETASRGGRRA